MKWPQIVIIVIMSLNCGIDLVQHGKEIEGTHSFWKTLINNIILAILLGFGGFWTN